MYIEETQKLMRFIEKSPDCYHAVAEMCSILQREGYEELSEGADWRLKPGGHYYVKRNQSSMIAFKLPADQMKAFMIIASHSDSPAYKIKPNPEIYKEDHYTQLNVEGYGGMICSTWLDRPLSVSGKVMVETESGVKSVLVCLDRDLLMIPNLAIHMNREINNGYSYNAQKDMIPIFGDGDAKGDFLKIIADAAGTAPEKIKGYDLFLYNRMKGSIWGNQNEYFSIGRIDDLQCAFSSLSGLLAGGNPNTVSVCAVLDNEEVGSGTKQGAKSTFLADVLERISAGLGYSHIQYRQALASSFMLSADNGHAVHPNHPEKSDPTNRPYMNGGVVIKYSANQKYTTDSVSEAVVKRICEYENIPYQCFANRSDMAGGSTLGNLSNEQVSLNTADIGLAQLAMHSSYETGGVEDTGHMMRLAEGFYNSYIEYTPDGEYVIHR